jgi:hypothetical protein
MAQFRSKIFPLIKGLLKALTNKINRKVLGPVPCLTEK